MSVKKVWFYFVRHAETDWSAQNLCQGHTDIPLNQKGLLEAQKLAAQLKNIQVSCIISSPLVRALRTAQAIQQVQIKAPIHIIREFAERSFGELEGRTNDQLYTIERFEEKNPTFNLGRGVESRCVFHQRVLKALEMAQNIAPHPLTEEQKCNTYPK